MATRFAPTALWLAAAASSMLYLRPENLDFHTAIVAAPGATSQRHAATDRGPGDAIAARHAAAHRT